MSSTIQSAKCNIHNILVSYICIFCLLFFYYALLGYKEHIPSYMLCLQLYYAITYIFICITSIKSSKTSSSIYRAIFAYSLFSSIVVRTVSWHYLNEPFLNAVDSVTYDYFATCSVSKQMSLSTYFEYIFNTTNLSVDDLGMTFILYIIYNIFGDSIWGQNIMLLLNSIVITIYSIKLNKIMGYYGIQKKVRHFCLAAFTCFPFLSLTAAVGMKENFFVFFIVLTFYYLTKYKHTGNRSNLNKALVFLFFTLFFRLAIFAILIITTFVLLISDNEKKKKTILYTLIISSIIGFMSLNFILEIIYGINLNQVLATTEYRSESMKSSMGGNTQWLVNVLSVFCGPFPNFNRVGQYAIVHSSGLMMKLMFNFYMIVGLGTIVLKYQNKQYHMLAYFLLNFVMLVLAGVALDMRYQITLYPIMMPLIAISLQEFNNQKIFWIYLLFITSIVFFYNNR